jgi:D-mannonate dehydratase
MIAIFMILVAFLFEKYSTSAYSELDRFAKNRVMQIAQNLEFTLRNLMNYGINMYNDEAINDWITSDLHTIERDIDANLSVNRYILTQPLIRGIYLINYKTNNIGSRTSRISKFSALSGTTLPHTSGLRCMPRRTSGTCPCSSQTAWRIQAAKVT